MTIEGAGLLAQIYPVGLLTLAVEGRMLLGRPWQPRPTRLRIKQRSPYWRQILSWRNLYSTIWALSIPTSILAIALCAWSVCTGNRLSDAYVVHVIWPGILLAIGVLWTLGRIIEPQEGPEPEG